jgi:2-polyprenyl-3-methyl-5-hydroxy-6-metoxy-1,4-benzoquinol methylase
MHEINWTPDKVKRIWDYYGRHLPREQYFSYEAADGIIKFLRGRAILKRGMSVLDYGCGAGGLMEKLLKKFDGRVYGLDFSKNSVDFVNDRFRGKPGYGGALYVENLPSGYDRESMDIVVCIEVIEHLEDVLLKATLDEIARVLKPGGHLVISTPNDENFAINNTICPECGCVFHRWQHVRKWTRESLAGCLREMSGMAVTSVEAITFNRLGWGVIVYLRDKLMEKMGMAPMPRMRSLVAVLRKKGV